MQDFDDGFGGLHPHWVARLSLPPYSEQEIFGIRSTHMHEHEKGFVHDWHDG